MNILSILIWDDNSARCESNQVALSKAAQELGRRIDVQVWTDPIVPGPKSRVRLDFHMLLLHETNTVVATGWLTSQRINPQFILKYGGNGVTTGVPRPISASSPLTVSEAKGILGAAYTAKTSKEFIVQVSHLWPGEALPALRLLCEAWLMNRHATNKNIVNSSQDHNGIIIHAPVTPDHWFAPFADGFTESSPSSEKKKAAENAAIKIAAEMKEAKDDVAAFLKKLANLYSNHSSENVARLEFENDIESLFRKLKSVSR